MKKFNNWLFMSLLLYVTLNLVACSDNEEEILPEFPEQVTINGNANSEATFSFNANMDWRLSSNKTWCTLASSEMEGQNISGKAGSQVVKVKVSEVGLSFEESKATLTLSMGESSKAVAEVVRAAKQYELNVFDMDGKMINSLSIDYQGTIEFIVEANFEFAATEFSKWLDVESWSDDAVQGKKSFRAIVKDEYAKDPQSQGSIVFSNETGSVSFPVNISYEGMDPTKIIISSNDIETYSCWNWKVTMDGKTFTRKNDLTATTDEVYGELKFNVIALNDAYTPVFIEDYNGEYYFDAAEWIHLKQNGETAILTVDESDRTRNGLVMLFPNAVYDKIKNDLAGNIVQADGTINYEYENKYMLISFTQKNEDSGAFFIRNGRTWEEVINTKVTDADILEIVKGNSAGQEIEDVYAIKVAPGTPLIVFPKLSVDSWICEMGAMIMGDNNPVLEAGIDEAGEHYLGYVVPETVSGNIYVFIKNASWQFLKVLVIIPEQ